MFAYEFIITFYYRVINILKINIIITSTDKNDNYVGNSFLMVI